MHLLQMSYRFAALGNATMMVIMPSTGDRCLYPVSCALASDASVVFPEYESQVRKNQGQRYRCMPAME